MIAATDPQEFIPSGRQQALQHPGPFDSVNTHDDVADQLLSQDFERVSIAENRIVERWSLRLSPEYFKDLSSRGNNNNDFKACTEIRENRCRLDGSYEWKSTDGNVSQKSKRYSDVNMSKAPHERRYSAENENRFSPNMNKSGLGASVAFKSLPIICKPLLEFMEEELYTKENTVIWSRGVTYNEQNTTRQIIASYSSAYPVKHTIWCTFYLERPIIQSLSDNVEILPDEPLGNPVPCVVIIDTQNLKAFSQDNEDFVTALSFQISRVWTTKFGILLERDVSGEYHRNKTHQNKIPTLFSLSHPLDEFSPISMKQGSIVQLVEDPLMQVVFTNEHPSICMIYDGHTGLHHVYKIRRLFANEWVDGFNKTGGDTHSLLSTSSKLKSCHTFWDNYQKTAAPSPFSTKSNSISSLPSHMPSRSQSPMAPLGRVVPPSASVNTSPWLLRSSRLNSLLRSVDASRSAVTDAEFESTQVCNNVLPKLCLEHLWSDTTGGNLETVNNGAASKAFLVDDFTGHWFLCYMIPARSQLSVVKVDVSNKSNLLFGMSTSISAKDAIPISNLHMYAILEYSGNVVLYSGLSMVGKLHIAGVLPQHVPSPYVVQNIRHMYSPFPRRSSLLPTCGSTAPDPRFDEHLLSPVLPSTTSKPSTTLHISGDMFTGDLNKPQLNGLRDPVLNRITLKYSDGTYYRVRLPLLATSPLVESCINALRETLHRDSVMTLLIRWYSTRNTIGLSDLTADKEWELFSHVLLQLLGYEDEHVSDASSDHTETESRDAKRLRQTHNADKSNWEYLLKSKHHKTLNNHLNKMLRLKKTPTLNHPSTQTHKIQININSVLYPHIRIVHYTLHLLYEDIKLNILRKNELLMLAELLSKMSFDLGLFEYQLHYWKDFPDRCLLVYEGRRALNEIERRNVISWSCMDGGPAGVFQFLYETLDGADFLPYPCIRNVNSRTRNILLLWFNYIKYATRLPEHQETERFIQIIVPPGIKPEPTVEHKLLSSASENNMFSVVEMMVNMGITNRELETYPISINLLLYDAIWQSRENPPSDWPPECYTLLHRPDLTTLASVAKKTNAEENLPMFSQTEAEHDDGMEDIDNALLKLRFPDDLRVHEVRRLLQSSKPVSIVLTQRPDVSDHDFIEEQERHLYALCSRTMSLPVGRGMFTLRMASPVVTEPLTVPPLCLTGKAPPRGTTVELSHIDTPATMNVWPLFHNGVANGLRITPEAKSIDSTWIVFNKPKGNSDVEHAGFLLALGLNGHLRNLATLNTFDYLSKFQEMISVGVLLGLSAAHRGTSNMQVTKMLSIHIEALLPPTSMELDVPQNVQVAGLLGIGLLYQGTAHRHMTEVLLNEIGRPPGPEMENSVDRESYSLSAGLALGLVVLAQGGKPCGLSDLNIADHLHYYMVGGNRRPLNGPQREKYRVASFQIKEGATVNLDITAPGATLALGLMYFGTGNKAVADWMTTPDTQYLLDAIRPDFLTLRTLSRALIMWNDISPSTEWVEAHIPEALRPFCMVEPNPIIDMDYEAVNQAYCNIVAGACFALGLRYAGTADIEVFQVLLRYCHMFTSLLGKSLAELAGKPTIESCLNLILLSTAMVMAGTGNLDIMRIVRHLRRRVGTAASAVVTYGSHLATHMALGLLFLGGGRYTLKNDPASVAALIIAFYPKFPMHSNDNRYHLQAFRHLYVLAVEARLIIPRDVIKGKMCYANIKVVRLNGAITYLRAPALLPELTTLYKIVVDDDRYWPVVFERGRNWELLELILSTYNCVDVKQRAGYVTFSEDRDGCRTEIAETLTPNNSLPWLPCTDSIISFTTDCTVWSFCNYFLGDGKLVCNQDEEKLKQFIARGSYDSVVKDKLNVLPVFLSLVKIVQNMKDCPHHIQLWQFKLATKLILRNMFCANIITNEGLLALEHSVMNYLDKQETRLRENLKLYVFGRIDNYKEDILRDFVTYLIYYDIPFHCPILENGNYLEKMLYLKSLKLPSITLSKILGILL